MSCRTSYTTKVVLICALQERTLQFAVFYRCESLIAYQLGKDGNVNKKKEKDEISAIVGEGTPCHLVLRGKKRKNCVAGLICFSGYVRS